MKSTTLVRECRFSSTFFHEPDAHITHVRRVSVTIDKHAVTNFYIFKVNYQSKIAQFGQIHKNWAAKCRIPNSMNGNEESRERPELPEPSLENNCFRVKEPIRNI